MLLHCNMFTAARREHLTVGGRPRNLSQLFNHPEARYHAATIHGGDGYLREAADSVGTGMRGAREHI